MAFEIAAVTHGSDKDRQVGGGVTSERGPARAILVVLCATGISRFSDYLVTRDI